MSDDAEDKIVLKTHFTRVSSNYQKCVPVEQLLAAFGETYRQAVNIGWETKALDELFESIRQLID